MFRLRDLPHEFWRIVEVIFSGFEGAVIVDEEGTVLVFTEYYEKESGLKREDVLGKKIYEIFPHTRMMEVIRTGKPIIADVWEVNGKTQIVSRVPIIADGRIVGAAGFNVFRFQEEARRFAAKISNLSSELAYYKEEVKKLSGAKYSLASIVGKSEGILEAKEKVRQVAKSNAPVLIYGETGTGKELFAHAIHQESPRRDGPLIRVNCASIPENLMESELFGYEEGAFSGARKGGKPGKFELAHRGSIFLDEINDLPYSMQPKLLRVLQEKELERVGGTEIREVDVRVISATNVDLATMVAKNRFRDDLFYRLNVFLIRVPPLRERLEDIPLLVEHFIRNYNQETGSRIEGIEPEALKLLTRYHWPGNVRELETSIERACVDAKYGIIKVENLFRFGGYHTANAQVAAAGTLKEVRKAAEKAAILNALRAAGGNRSKAAQILGIHRTSLHSKLREYGIEDEIPNTANTG